MKVDRKDYWVDDDGPWTHVPGAVGVEIGDVQDSDSLASIPLYLTCSVREFWVPIPETMWEINFRCNGFDVQLDLEGLKLIHGSCVGTDTAPFVREVQGEESVIEEQESEKSGRAEVDGQASTSGGRLKLLLKGSIGRSGRRINHKTIKKFVKKIETRVSYFPHMNWHIRPEFSDGNDSYFSGTVFSGIICRLEGLDTNATASVTLSIPAEFISSTDIREIKTAEKVDVNTVRNPGARVGDADVFIDNKKLAVINALIRSLNSDYSDSRLPLAKHTIRFGRDNDAS